MGASVLRVCAFACAMMGFAASLAAAELKISFVELARILNAELGAPKLRLHNVPPATFSLTPGSSLTFGTTTVPLPLGARTFVVGGSTYAYYVNELNSNKIAISAVPGALRLTITFEDAGPELIGKCIEGFCVSDSALPEIEWNSPIVTIDLVPTTYAGSLSLTASRVDVGGTFAPDCDAATGIFSGSLCKIVLPKARSATAALRTELSKTLLSQINAPTLQNKLASTVRGYLKLGPAGDVTISRVVTDQTSVTLTFCLACQTQ